MSAAEVHEFEVREEAVDDLDIVVACVIVKDVTHRVREGLGLAANTRFLGTF